MGVGLEQQLRPVRSFLRYHGDPGVLSHGDVVLHLKAEDVRVESKRLLLVVHDDAGQVDSHSSLPSSIECEVPSSVEMGHRSPVVGGMGAPSKQWSLRYARGADHVSCPAAEPPRFARLTGQSR